jgi:hypothetical protein
VYFFLKTFVQVKLKLLDATRKAIIDKQKKQITSTAMQTDNIKTKLCKDQFIDNQSDLLNLKDAETETDVELVALKTKDGTGNLLFLTY